MEECDSMRIGTVFTKNLISHLVSSLIEKKLDCDCKVELKGFNVGHMESGDFGVDVDAKVCLSIPPEKVKELIENLL